MKHWIIYGEINNGRDGFPNNVGEMTSADYYSGQYAAPNSHEELIMKFCDARKSHTREIEQDGFYSNLNGEKFRRYRVEVSPHYKREFVWREFLTRCEKTTA